MNGTTCQQMLLNPILSCASKDTLILFYKLASLIITVTMYTQNSDYRIAQNFGGVNFWRMKLENAFGW